MRTFARIFLLVFALSLSAQARDYQRTILLKRGQRSTSSVMRLPSPGDSGVFSFEAHSGQHVLIEIKPISRSLITQAVLICPSGKQYGPGQKMDQDLEESGTYQIRVVARQQTSGSFRVSLTLR